MVRLTIWKGDAILSMPFTDISKQESDKLGVFASIVGHVGDGNFHQAVMYDAKNKEHVQAVEDCVHKMMDRAVELGGTVSVSTFQSFLVHHARV